MEVGTRCHGGEGSWQQVISPVLLIQRIIRKRLAAVAAAVAAVAAAVAAAHLCAVPYIHVSVPCDDLCADV